MQVITTGCTPKTNRTSVRRSFPIGPYAIPSFDIFCVVFNCRGGYRSWVLIVAVLVEQIMDQCILVIRREQFWFSSSCLLLSLNPVGSSSENRCSPFKLGLEGLSFDNEFDPCSIRVLLQLIPNPTARPAVVSR